MQSSVGSVTFWIDRLKAGERDAVQNLWEGYFHRLVGLARTRLHASVRQMADEEDVALSAFHSFCRAAEAGRFPRLDDRDDLWKLLVFFAKNKAANLVKHQQTQKKGSGKVHAVSALAVNDEEPAGFVEMLSREPDPQLAAEVAEECERLLNLLDEPELRQIAVWKLEGFTNAEIGEKISRSIAAVERKLKRIRECWEDCIDLSLRKL